MPNDIRARETPPHLAVVPRWKRGVKAADGRPPSTASPAGSPAASPSRWLISDFGGQSNFGGKYIKDWWDGAKCIVIPGDVGVTIYNVASDPGLEKRKYDWVILKFCCKQDVGDPALFHPAKASYPRVITAGALKRAAQGQAVECRVILGNKSFIYGPQPAQPAPPSAPRLDRMVQSSGRSMLKSGHESPSSGNIPLLTSPRSYTDASRSPTSPPAPASFVGYYDRSKDPRLRAKDAARDAARDAASKAAKEGARQAAAASASDQAVALAAEVAAENAFHGTGVHIGTKMGKFAVSAPAEAEVASKQVDGAASAAKRTKRSRDEHDAADTNRSLKASRADHDHVAGTSASSAATPQLAKTAEESMSIPVTATPGATAAPAAHATAADAMAAQDVPSFSGEGSVKVDTASVSASDTTSQGETGATGRVQGEIGRRTGATDSGTGTQKDGTTARGPDTAAEAASERLAEVRIATPSPSSLSPIESTATSASDGKLTPAKLDLASAEPPVNTANPAESVMALKQVLQTLRQVEQSIGEVRAETDVKDLVKVQLNGVIDRLKIKQIELINSLLAD